MKYTYQKYKGGKIKQGSTQIRQEVNMYLKKRVWRKVINE